MTTDNTENLDTPKSPTLEDMDQLPKGQRHYIHDDEVGKYRALGYRIYTGKREGTYIDENEQEREKPWQAVNINQKWVEDYIKFDETTGKPREVTPPFNIRTTDENSGERVSMKIEGLYKVPNHGPNIVEFEDGVKRPYIQSEPPKAEKNFVNHEGKRVKKGSNLKPKRNMHGQIKVKTSRAALLLDGAIPIPVEATDVYISGEKDDPLQAIFTDKNGNRKIVWTPKETQRRRDVFWSYKAEALKDIDDLVENLWADEKNMDEWSDSQLLVALISITAFRHGDTGRPRRLPISEEEEAEQKELYPGDQYRKRRFTGERTGIGGASLIGKEVIMGKNSVTFKFLGKENIPQEHTYTNSTAEGRRVLSIMSLAMKGKGPEDKVFGSGNTRNLTFLNNQVKSKNRPMSITALGETYSELDDGVPVTTRPLQMKDFRTWKATRMAEEELAKRGKPKYKKVRARDDEKQKEAIVKHNQALYAKLRQEIGLIAGTKLGHKTLAPLTPSQKRKDEKEGTVTEREWKHKHDMAINNYIKPSVWEGFQPPEEQKEVSKAELTTTDVLTKLLKTLESLEKAKGKYKGRTGGITPDWTMKLPGEERDIDEWAEARRKKAEEKQWGIKPVGGQPMAKTWVGSLNDKGFSSPLIKQVLGSQMWFIQDGVDYVATLGNDVVTTVEKATFTYNKPSVSYAPSGRNNHNSNRRSSGKQGERYQGDTIDDEEDY